jgi:ubiquinone/menaquinone biosynthesis C-methylase UbiE
MDWYQSSFTGNAGKFWVDMYYNERTALHTAGEIDFLEGFLKKGNVLDLCSGPGRHSIPLSLNRSIVSFDLSTYLLSILREKSKKEGCRGNVSLLRGDMRRLPLISASFDNVINMQTSFGFFSDDENEKVIQEVSRVLKPDGFFMLDITNPAYAIANFHERAWFEDFNSYVLDERVLDWGNKRVKTRIIVISKENGSSTEILTYTRLYDLKELLFLLKKAQFEIVNVFGSPRKEPYQETSSSRMLILSQKKALF